MCRIDCAPPFTGRQSVVMHGLFDRVSRLVRSNVTGVVQKLEDPEKIIEQAVADMQKDLIKVLDINVLGTMVPYVYTDGHR